MHSTVLPRTLLAAALLLRLCFVLLLPEGATVRHRLEGLNDEPSHWNYVRYVREHQRLPVQSSSTADADAFTRSEYEYYQPPLYYLACVPLAALLGDEAGHAAGRLLSFVLGVLTLLVLYRLLRAAGQSETVAWAGTLFVAFLPSHAYFSSVVSNDAGSWLLAALVLLQLVRLSAADGSFPRKLGFLILWLTLGLWTKSATLMLLPVVAVVAARLRFHGQDRRAAALLLGALAALALVAPWYARNHQLYGSWLALEVGFGASQAWVHSAGDVLAILRSTVRFFWFPMQHVPPNGIAGAVEIVVAGLTLALGAAFGLYLRRRRGLSLAEWLLLASVVVALAAHLRLNWTWFNPEGRYLFPGLAGIAYFVVVPIASLLGSRRERWLPVLATGLAVHPYLYFLAVG